MITIYVTCSDSKEARKIAKHLLKEKLIACANVFPVESLYNWKGKLHDEKETALFCKAKKSDFTDVETAVKKLHSYEVPCIVAFDWTASNKDYAKWVETANQP